MGRRAGEPVRVQLPSGGCASSSYAKRSPRSAGSVPAKPVTLELIRDGGREGVDVPQSAKPQ